MLKYFILLVTIIFILGWFSLYRVRINTDLSNQNNPEPKLFQDNSAIILPNQFLTSNGTILSFDNEENGKYGIFVKKPEQEKKLLVKDVDDSKSLSENIHSFFPTTNPSIFLASMKNTSLSQLNELYFLNIDSGEFIEFRFITPLVKIRAFKGDKMGEFTFNEKSYPSECIVDEGSPFPSGFGQRIGESLYDGGCLSEKFYKVKVTGVDSKFEKIYFDLYKSEEESKKTEAIISIGLVGEGDLGSKEIPPIRVNY